MIYALTKIPLVGLFIEDAVYGEQDAKYFFAFNCVILLSCLIFNFGYPFLICLLLLLAGSFLVFLVFFTATDMIENYIKQLKRVTSTHKDKK